MAEREGFEPSIRYQRIHEFQSCALDQLSHLSTTLIFYHIPEELSRTFFKCFLIPLRICTNFEKLCLSLLTNTICCGTIEKTTKCTYCFYIQ